MNWRDKYFDYALGIELMVIAITGTLSLLSSGNLYFNLEIFSAALAAAITTFGLKYMKRLTS